MKMERPNEFSLRFEKGENTGWIKRTNEKSNDHRRPSAAKDLAIAPGTAHPRLALHDLPRCRCDGSSLREGLCPSRSWGAADAAGRQSPNLAFSRICKKRSS
ncbi:hypothetical protein U9M48_040049 [Paspalum notatum var. saurae]|uniref:Uncharacterized protein n=1 Tax=Paspalum notatum var. saurae TaxID=547442 RepID=A0AAQ3UK75_PASNO